MTFSSQRKEPSTQSLDLEGRKLPQVSVDRVHVPLKYSILLTASWLPLTIHTPGTQGRSSLDQIPWKNHLEWLQTSRPQGQRTCFHLPSLSMEPEKEQQTIRRAGAGPKLATALFVAAPLTSPSSPQCPQSQWAAGLGICDDQ